MNKSPAVQEYEERQQLQLQIDQMRDAIGAWARARAAMNGVKINTPECAAAFDALGAAETALAALAVSATNGDGASDA